MGWDGFGMLGYDVVRYGMVIQYMIYIVIWYGMGRRWTLVELELGSTSTTRYGMMWCGVV